MQVEWVVLADAAEVVDNKLYLLGGGWTRLTVHSGFPAAQHCAVATAVLVDWEETQQSHEFSLEVYDPEEQLISAIEAEFEVGRPHGVPADKPQRWQFAGDFDLVLDGPGTHTVMVVIGGEELCRQDFEVVKGVRAADLPG